MTHEEGHFASIRSIRGATEDTAEPEEPLINFGSFESKEEQEQALIEGGGTFDTTVFDQPLTFGERGTTSEPAGTDKPGSIVDPVETVLTEDRAAQQGAMGPEPDASPTESGGPSEGGTSVPDENRTNGGGGNGAVSTSTNGDNGSVSGGGGVVGGGGAGGAAGDLGLFDAGVTPFGLLLIGGVGLFLLSEEGVI